MIFDRINSRGMKALGYLLSGAIAILTNGCSSSDTLRMADQSYFPLRVGNYQIYQVIETTIQHIRCEDTDQPTKTYQLKVLTYDSLRNTDGNYVYLIHRYVRNDSTQAWTDLDSWSAKVTANQVILNEGNTSYVKLFFPLVSNGKWNGNLYNNLGTENYRLTNFNQSFQLSNGKKYPTSLTVVQSDNQDFFVYQDKRIEVYAPSVGLIFKETTQLTYFQDPCYGLQKVKSGIIYSQTLKSSSHE